MRHSPVMRIERERLEYIASMLRALSDVAAQHKLDMLGYLIDMAVLEAKEILFRTKPRDEEESAREPITPRPN